ncbi:MAG TPA: YciI family protein [Devosia sp.]|nr:YciI family protein [Devosia sp.]
MRFLMMVKIDPGADRGEVRRSDLNAMDEYNQALRDAGALVAVDGLRDSSHGSRVTFEDGGAVVKDGPFTESKELVAGFWILELGSHTEAIEWAKRIPFANGEGVEIRQIAEDSDFENIK